MQHRRAFEFLRLGVNMCKSSEVVTLKRYAQLSTGNYRNQGGIRSCGGITLASWQQEQHYCYDA
jgi:hypothetical protein